MALTRVFNYFLEKYVILLTTKKITNSAKNLLLTRSISKYKCTAMHKRVAIRISLNKKLGCGDEISSVHIYSLILNCADNSFQLAFINIT